MVKSKEQRIQGITLIALVITIIVLLILAGVAIATLTGDNGILTNAKKAKEETNRGNIDEEMRLQGLLDMITEVNPTTDGYSEAKAVNSPKLSKGMIPIKWNGSNWEVCSKDDSSWYAYDNTKQWANIMLSDGTYKDHQVKEGQIIQENELGSMYVWIPRYAYQIQAEKNIDVSFLMGNTNKDKDGNEYQTESANVDTKVTKIVHPAFTLGNRELTGIWVAKFEASGTNQNGQAVGNASSTSSNQQYTPDSATIAKSLPNVISWRHITIGESEYQSMAITGTNKDKYGIDYASSHLIKNDEWGAVAYLCYSQYGNVPAINGTGSSASSGYWYDFYTGQGPLNASSENSYSNDVTNHGYSTTLGMLASTTGNITGIYDMNGGAWERVAGYLDNGNISLTNYGYSQTNENIKYFEGGKLNSEYTSIWNAYEVGEEEKNNQIAVEGEGKISQASLWSQEKMEKKYHVARQRITQSTYENMAKHKGIGVNEVSMTGFSFYAPYTNSSGTKTWGWFQTADQATEGTVSYARAWDNDYVFIGHASFPFVIRGGGCVTGSSAGVFFSHITEGDAYYSYGFRSVLVL